MHRITTPLHARVLKGSMRAIGYVAGICARRMLDAGISSPDLVLTFLGEKVPAHPDTATERLVVLQLLQGRDPHSRSGLEHALGEVQPRAIDRALDALEAEDLLDTRGDEVWASRCIRHLDKLGLIAI